MRSTVGSERAFARTYGTDAWATVTQYRQATTLRERHPEMARAEIARRVGRPQSAVRGWLAENKTPPPVQGVRTARDRGWIGVDPATESARVLNDLVAWTFASGSIARDTFHPRFVIDSPLACSVLDHLLTVANVPHSVRRADGRSDEMVATERGATLGRALVALGAPVGDKTEPSGLRMPDYLDDCTRARRRDFARVYVFTRCLNRPNWRIGERRPDRYTRALYTFFDSLDDGAVLYDPPQLWPSTEFVASLADADDCRAGPAMAARIAFGSLSPPTARALAGSYDPDRRSRLRGYRAAIQSTVDARAIRDHHDDVTLQMVDRWRADSTPAVGATVDAARDRGWLTADLASDTSVALTGLAAWLVARGTLRHSFHPVFGFDRPAQRTAIEALADELSLATRITLESDDRPTELHVTTDATALGRTLFVRGIHPGAQTPSLAHLGPVLATATRHAGSGWRSGHSTTARSWTGACRLAQRGVRASALPSGSRG